MYFFCHLFVHFHFFLASIPSISLRSLPLFMLRLSHPLSVLGTPSPHTPPSGAGVGQKGWRGIRGGETGVWASSGGGAWTLVCLRAPNESVIHGTRGSHRDRIRGARSNRSPERVKRYLICPPRRQLPLGSVCVFVGVCASVNVSEGCWQRGREPHVLERPTSVKFIYNMFKVLCALN